jgi:hypothetical protein
MSQLPTKRWGDEIFLPFSFLYYLCPMARVKNKKYMFKNMELDSKGELDFVHYLEELRLAGYVSSWDRSPSFQITEGLKHEYTEVKQLKTKTKTTEKSQVLLEPSIYTPDFVVVFTRKANGVFLRSMNSSEKLDLPFIGQPNELIHVECKPSRTFDPNNMLRLFRVNQKFMWSKHKVYVNLIITDDLFKETFTPLEVNVPIARKTKKAKWAKKTLKQFINAGNRATKK